MKSRLNSENACYHSVHNPSSSCLLSKDIKIKIYKTVLLPVGLYGCENWPHTKERLGLRIFKNRVLKKYFDLR
jgi:hypothetical protein